MHKDAIFWAYGLTWATLLWISLQDFYTYRIPDIGLIPLGGLGVFLAYQHHDLALQVFDAGVILTIVLGAKLGLEAVLKKPALGWGDVKLLPICALFVPPQQLGWFLFGVGAVGILLCLCSRQRYIPLGPAICGVTAFITLFRN